jgi:hypothetical protein
VVVPDTLQSARKKWVPEIRQYSRALIVFLGLQADRRSDSRILEGLAVKGKTPVTIGEANIMAEELKVVAALECTGKENSVATAMETIIQMGAGEAFPLPVPSVSVGKLLLAGDKDSVDHVVSLWGAKMQEDRGATSWVYLRAGGQSKVVEIVEVTSLYFFFQKWKKKRDRR